MNICESLTVTANLVPDQTALVFGHHRLSYQQLNSLSIAAASHLVKRGVKPGERVALMLPNAPSFPVWYYATLRIGAIAVSVSTRLAPAEVAFIVSDSNAKAFIGSESALESVDSELPDSVSVTLAVKDASGKPVQANDIAASFDNSTEENAWHCGEPNDPALILYTSGTTGFPKGATLSHANVRSNVHAFNHLCEMRSDDRVLLAVPLFHCFGQNALLNSVLNVGGTIVLQQKFDLNESKRLIAEHQITQLYGVPMMFGLLLESCTPSDLVSIRYCFSAAATLPIQTSRSWQEKFGQPIYEGYGLTETSPFASYNHRVKYRLGSIGMPIDSVEMKVVDTETGSECETGQLGEIAIRGPNVMLGYWNRPEETAQAIREGWFHSGDIGRTDDEGFFYIVDRVKDMITVGGLKVFPAEVERVLLDHASVSQTAIVGAPDPVFGEQVIAYVVLGSNESQDDVIPDIEKHVKSNVGNYKAPRRIVVVDELPRNPSGKILKTKLREMAKELVSSNWHSPKTVDIKLSSSSTALKPPTLCHQLAATFESEKKRVAIEFLQRQIQELSQTKVIPNPEASFIEAGLDSLAIVDLSAQLQVEVGPDHSLPPTLLFDYPRVCDLAEFLVVTIQGETLPENSADQRISTAPSEPSEQNRQSDQLQPDSLRSDIEQLSEEEALAQLMKELG